MSDSSSKAIAVRAPTKQQTAKIIDKMFRENAATLLPAFFEKVMERVKGGDPLALQMVERIYGLSKQSPAVAVQINNTNNNNINTGKSRDRRFEGIVELLEKRSNERPASDVVDAEFTEVKDADKQA